MSSNSYETDWDSKTYYPNTRYKQFTIVVEASMDLLRFS